MKKQNYCIDCHKEICCGSERCSKCNGIAHSGKNSLCYIDGRSLKKGNCIDCGKEINWQSKRCPKCAGIILSNKRTGTPWSTGSHLKEYCCKVCNKKISISSGVYGSGKCTSCSRRKHDKEFYVKFCIDCNKKLNEAAYYFGTLRCLSCSMKYKIKIGTIKLSGKDSPKYKDGKGREPYPSIFTPELKDSIRKRDSYECQYCGMTEKEHLKKYNRKLEVHHKDHNKKNCKEWNLLTLCKSCNLNN
jgi:hypothetical protein